MNRRSFLQAAAFAPVVAAFPAAAVAAYPEIVDEFPNCGWDMGHRDFGYVMTQTQARRIAKRALSNIPGLVNVENFFINGDDWTPVAIAAMSEVARVPCE